MSSPKLLSKTGFPVTLQCPNCDRDSLKYQGLSTSGNPMYSCRPSKKLTPHPIHGMAGCKFAETKWLNGTKPPVKGPARIARDCHVKRKEAKVLFNMLHPVHGHVGVKITFSGHPTFSGCDLTRPNVLYCDFIVGRFHHRLRSNAGIKTYSANIK